MEHLVAGVETVHGLREVGRTLFPFRVEPQHEARAVSQDAVQLAEMQLRIVPEVDRMDRIPLVEELIRVRNMRAVADREAHTMLIVSAEESPRGHLQHLLGSFDADHQALRDHARRSLDGTSVPEADLQHPVRWLQIERLERLVVRGGRLERHDVADHTAEEPARTARLTGDELGPPHELTPLVPENGAETEHVGHTCAEDGRSEADGELVDARDAAPGNDEDRKSTRLNS